MWELDCEESWAWKNWCFWTVVLEKTLESPLDCKEIQLVLLKEINPGCSLEGPMLKLKLQYFGHLMRRVDSLEKTLMLGGIGGRRRRGRRRIRWLDSITDSMDMGLGESRSWWLLGGLACCDSWGCRESDTTEGLIWTEGCHNKIPETGWLKQQKFYFLIMMEVKSPRWRFWQRHYLANKGPSSQTYGFSSVHVWMWELDYKESWVLKNWCFWAVVLEKTFESPLDSKEIQPVHPKGNHPEYS